VKFRPLYEKLFCLAVVLLLTVGRAPELLIRPRFWAEDGTMYFSTPYHNGFLAGLISPHDGYFSLISNIGGILSALLPLEHAPYGVTAVALLVQILVSSLVIFGRSTFWDTFPKKLVLSAAIPLLAPGEIWLNTANCQHWMCAAGFILLMEPKSGLTTVRRNAYRLVLVLAGFTSVTALFLAPAYLLKAWREKTREEWIHFTTLSGASLFHLIVVLYAVITAQNLNDRFAGNTFVLIDVMLFNFVQPFFSTNLFLTSPVLSIDWWFFEFGKAVLGEPTFDWPRFSEIVSCGGMLAWFMAVAWRNRECRQCLLLIIAFASVLLFSTLFSVKLANGPRYAFAPSFMLLALLCGHVTTDLFFGYLRGSTLAILLLVFTLKPLDFRNSHCLDYSWPKWRDELVLWRKDPGYSIRIWPQWSGREKKWDLSLSPRQAK